MYLDAVSLSSLVNSVHLPQSAGGVIGYAATDSNGSTQWGVMSVFEV
jgi:hypothetical protein